MKEDSKNKFVTNSGITLDEVYTSSSLEQTGFKYEKNLGALWEYPFTRAITPSMDRKTRGL